MTPTLYGHRGARGEAPENTVPGFAYAQRIGVTAFELDVHLSSDQELVVIHDPDVDRTTNGHGPVSAFTASELAALDARAAFPAWPEPSGVPRLVDVLDAFAGTQTFQIEIKTNTADVLEVVAQKLVDLIGRYAIGDRTEVSSFDPAALAIMRRIAPRSRAPTSAATTRPSTWRPPWRWGARAPASRTRPAAGRQSTRRMRPACT